MAPPVRYEAQGWDYFCVPGRVGFAAPLSPGFSLRPPGKNTKTRPLGKESPPNRTDGASASFQIKTTPKGTAAPGWNEAKQGLVSGCPDNPGRIHILPGTNNRARTLGTKTVPLVPRHQASSMAAASRGAHVAISTIINGSSSTVLRGPYITGSNLKRELICFVNTRMLMLK